MEVKLYVGNLSFDTTEEQIRTLFTEAGTVSAIDMIRDRDTHELKGFAFVTMSTQAEAEKAISTFNAKEFNGRPLTVNAARPREDRPAYGGGRSFNNNRGGGHKRSGGSNNRY